MYNPLNHIQEKEYSEVSWAYNGDINTILVIHTLAVHPAYFNLGIGGKLIQFAEVYAKENNMNDIRLDVYEKNLPAIDMNDASMFVQEKLT